MHRWRRQSTSRRDFLASCSAVPIALDTISPSLAQPVSKKPRLVAGKDPGGVAVALLGAGIDYTQPMIAAQLARDGEGEAIAWDVIDNDAQPFEAPQPHWATPVLAGGTEMARLLLDEARGCRLIVVRVSENSVLTLAKGLNFAGQTPARVAVVLAGPGREEGHEALAAIVKARPQLLVIMPSMKVLRFLAADVPPAFGLNNLLVATAADLAGAAIPGLPMDGARIDVAIATDPVSQPAGMAPLDVVTYLENRAAVRLAALACRLLAGEPLSAGAALKTRLLQLAKVVGEAHGPRTQAGVISDINKLLQPK